MYRICVGLFVVIFGISLKTENNKFNFDFYQNDYHILPERMEVVRYHKQLMKHFQLMTFKYNRTCTAFNLTVNFNFNVNNSMEIVVQAYKFASNEYRFFPLRFQYNYCQAVSLQLFGYGKSKCGNFSKCGFLKGNTYQVCNWVPDESRFPPYIPTGNYMVELQGMYFSTELFVVNFLEV